MFRNLIMFSIFKYFCENKSRQNVEQYLILQLQTWVVLFRHISFKNLNSWRYFYNEYNIFSKHKSHLKIKGSRHKPQSLYDLTFRCVFQLCYLLQGQSSASEASKTCLVLSFVLLVDVSAGHKQMAERKKFKKDLCSFLVFGSEYSRMNSI